MPLCHQRCNTSLLHAIAGALNIPYHRLNVEQSFVQHGGDSIAALKLMAAARKHALMLDVSTILRSSNLQTLLTLVVPLDDSRGQSDSEQIHDRKSLIAVNTLRSIYEQDSHDHSGCVAPATTTQQAFLCPSKDFGHRHHTLYYLERWPTKHLERIKTAWNDALAAEPIFSTQFVEVEGRLLMRGHSFQPPIWNHLVVSNVQEPLFDQHEILTALEGNEMMRFTVIEDCLSSESTSAIIWAVNHACIDWLSLGMVRRKMLARVNGEEIPRGPCFVQFARDLERYQTDNAARAVEFWWQQTQQYGKTKSHFRLHSTSYVDAKFSCGEVGFEFPSERLKHAAALLKVPRSALYFAAWALVCSMLCDSDHISFGAVLSGRSIPLEHTRDLVGPLVHTLPFALNMQEVSDLQSLATVVAGRLTNLSEYAWSLPKHGYTTQYESALDIQHTLDVRPNRSIQPVGGPMHYFKSDIPWSVSVLEEGSIKIVYHSHRYDALTAQVVSDLYEHALGHIADCQSFGICLVIPVGLPRSMEATVRSYSRASLALSRRQSSQNDLISIFRATAAIENDNLAIVRGGDSLTYSQLDCMSDCVAAQVSSLIISGQPVGVLADRSIYWLVAVYGVLKAKGVYYPINPSLPANVRDEQFRTANSKVFIAPQNSDLVYAPISCDCSLTIHQLLSNPNSPTWKEISLEPPAASSPAYLCFTSGSLGRPKGVVCRHESLVAFQHDFDVRLRARPGWRIAQTMSPSFDGSIHEIFSTLSYGATLVLPNDGEVFAHLKRADSAILTPTVAKSLHPDDVGDLSVVYLVGETVSQEVCDKWARKKIVFNMYGPTEATGGATIKRLSINKSVTVGKPNPSSRVYIMDRNMNVVPPFVAGQLYIAGVQVSSGYISSEASDSTSSFLPDSICPETNESMYRTGDFGYWDANGEIGLIGRQDRQIKLKGYRIDLDDIECRILKAVPSSVSVAAFVKNNNLYAALCPANLDMKEVQASVSNYLSGYMRPQRVILISSLPRTAADKIDLRTIEAMFETYDTGTENLPSMTDNENKLGAMWKKALPLHTADAEISPTSRLYDLGGDSLTVMEIRLLIFQGFGVQVPLRKLLKGESLREMAEIIETMLASALSSSPSLPPSEQVVEPYENPSSLELEWWNRYQNEQQTEAFNVSFACAMQGAVDRSRLAMAWNMVLAHYSLFASRFYGSKNCVKRSLFSKPPEVKMVAELDIHHEINVPFILCEDYLIRVILDPNHMLVIASHIICDLTTLRNTLREVRKAYNGLALSPSHLEIAHPPIERISMESRGLWERWLFDEYCAIHAPEHPVSDHTHNGSIILETPENLLVDIKRFTSMHALTVHQFLLAVCAIALSPEPHQKIDVILGAPHINRNSEDEMNAMGLFVQALPIRVRWPLQAQSSELISTQSNRDTPAKALHAYLQGVRKASEFALGNAIPWTILQDHCVERGLISPGNDIFDVMVTFNDYSQWEDYIVKGLVPKLTWSRGAKFNCLCEWTNMGIDSTDSRFFLRIESRGRWYTDQQIKDLASNMIAIAARLVNDGDLGIIRSDQ